MKSKFAFIAFVVFAIAVLLLTGCLKRNDMPVKPSGIIEEEPKGDQDGMDKIEEAIKRALEIK